MNPFELYISYISWGGNGKYRPILVFAIKDGIVYAHPVTSRYETKSEAIRAGYFKLNDWTYAGLDRQSYIDTGNCLVFPMSALDDKTPIGKLSTGDKIGLLEFLSKRT